MRPLFHLLWALRQLCNVLNTKLANRTIEVQTPVNVFTKRWVLKSTLRRYCIPRAIVAWFKAETTFISTKSCTVRHNNICPSIKFSAKMSRNCGSPMSSSHSITCINNIKPINTITHLMNIQTVSGLYYIRSISFNTTAATTLFKVYVVYLVRGQVP